MRVFVTPYFRQSVTSFPKFPKDEDRCLMSNSTIRFVMKSCRVTYLSARWHAKNYCFEKYFEKIKKL